MLLWATFGGSFHERNVGTIYLSDIEKDIQLELWFSHGCSCYRLDKYLNGA